MFTQTSSWEWCKCEASLHAYTGMRPNSHDLWKWPPVVCWRACARKSACVPLCNNAMISHARIVELSATAPLHPPLVLRRVVTATVFELRVRCMRGRVDERLESGLMPAPIFPPPSPPTSAKLTPLNDDLHGEELTFYPQRAWLSV